MNIKWYLMRNFLFIVMLFLTATVSNAQSADGFVTVDSVLVQNRLPAIITRTTLIKTATNTYYEIIDTVNREISTQQPMIVVYKGSADIFFAKIEGIDRLLPCIKLREVIETYIDGEFKGWDGTSTFKLSNLQEWQPIHAAPAVATNLLHPLVYVFLTPEGYQMKIMGYNTEPIMVKKVRG